MQSLRNLDLNLLVVFETIYSSGNISHAAKTLGVSQPTISNALTRLRETLDDQLFVRAGRGVEPTPKALQIIGPVREALQMIESGVANDGDFDPQSTQRHFKMVLLDQLEPILMPAVLRRIQAYQSISIETYQLFTTSVVDALNDGSLDLAVAPFVHELDDISCECLGPVRVVMVARKGHPAIGDTFTLENFQSIGHVALVQKLRALTKLDEILRHLELQRHVVYTVTKFWSFPHVIANTDLVALLPGDFAAEAAKYYPLNLYPVPFDLPEQQVYMTWKKNRSNDPGHRWLREQISTAYAERDV